MHELRVLPSLVISLSNHILLLQSGLRISRPVTSRRRSSFVKVGLDTFVCGGAAFLPPNWMVDPHLPLQVDPIIKVAPLACRLSQHGPPLLLFDLNHVLLHRRYHGPGQRSFPARPGVLRLLDLVPRYRLALFSSAIERNVREALGALHRAMDDELEALHREVDRKPQMKNGKVSNNAGVTCPSPTLPTSVPAHLFDVVLTRQHCVPAPPEEIAARGGDPWDTVKQLDRYFDDLDRVLLIDNSAHKAYAPERDNMVLVPAWEGPEVSERDIVLPRLVDLLLKLDSDIKEGKKSADLRKHSAALSAALSAPDDQEASSEDK